MARPESDLGEAVAVSKVASARASVKLLISLIVALVLARWLAGSCHVGPLTEVWEAADEVAAVAVVVASCATTVAPKK